jgi:peptidoglycan/xylan/chitin deacetylase (PgdA/CDA1 family)
VRPAVRAVGRATRPAALLVRTARRRATMTVIGWHRFDDLPGGLSTPIEIFGRQLDTLMGWGASVLPLEECLRRQVAGSLPHNAVALTFDDGYASVIDAAWPMLKARGLPATLFVVSGYLEGSRRFAWDAATAGREHTRISSIDDIRRAADDGLDVGSHTVTHRWLPQLSTPNLQQDLLGSRATLEWELGRPVRSLAYPMGGWDARVRDAAATAGYRCGVTTDRGVNLPRRDPLALRRSVAPTNIEDFELLLDGAYTWLRPVDRWRTRKGPGP